MPVPTIEQLQAQAEKTFAEAEARGTRWHPDDGIYSAVLSGFESSVRTQKDPKPPQLAHYASYEVSFILTDGDYEDKETSTFFDAQIRKWKDSDGVDQVGSISMGQFKTLCAILNDGVVPASLSECAVLVEACAGSKQAVQIKVESRKDKKTDRIYKSISIVELGSVGT